MNWEMDTEVPTYHSDPVDKVCIVVVLGNEVCRNAHNNNRRDPVQPVIGKDGRSMSSVGATHRRAIVVRDGRRSSMAAATKSAKSSHCRYSGADGVFWCDE
jgi:hypothetical protein